jgi:para-aminobenzoate synthetase component 1
VNLAISFTGELCGSPVALYDRLASSHPVPYGAYVDCGDFTVLSNSPELFLRRRGGSITTRPIKGTRPRGETDADDARRREELRTDVKERAEHVMIVDLERNDLGRVAEIGSVRVEELEIVRSYPTLHHLESTVTARLSRETRFSDILRATFPGGSITGAPKIRAIQIISELECERRGVYTGAILHHLPNGDFTMSIAIRTATVTGTRVRYAAGGAVVWDSTARAEYRECLLKAQAFLEAAKSA